MIGLSFDQGITKLTLILPEIAFSSLSQKLTYSNVDYCISKITITSGTNGSVAIRFSEQ